MITVLDLQICLLLLKNENVKAREVKGLVICYYLPIIWLVNNNNKNNNNIVK